MNELLIFGLGNPTREYEDTYHNAGLLALGYLQNRQELERHAKTTGQDSFWYRKYDKLILSAANPAFFMNESGTPVREALSFFKLKPERLIVLHDDSDLYIGELKMEFGRGAAGHHGVESVIKELGTKEFWRGRIGIRPPEEERRKKAGEFVLKKISAADKLLLDKVFQMLETNVTEKV